MGSGHVHTCAKFPSLSRQSREEEIVISKTKGGSGFFRSCFCVSLKELAAEKIQITGHTITISPYFFVNRDRLPVKSLLHGEASRLEFKESAAVATAPLSSPSNFPDTSFTYSARQNFLNIAPN